MESIYDLIPRPQVVPARAPRYHSKFPGEVEPKEMGMGASRKPSATFGPPSGANHPNPTTFLKKHQKEPVLPDPAPPSFSKGATKPPVPARGERPVMGLVSSKNFITVNAVENILAKPKKTDQEEMMWTAKSDFGKVPTYIQKNKQKVNEERKRVEEYHALQRQRDLADAGVIREISHDERAQMLKHLKLKWASVNAAYQKLTFTLDTPAKTKRKEEYERQLTEIEKDIRMMEKGEHLLVVAD